MVGRSELALRLESSLRRTMHALNARTKESLAQFGLTLPRLWALVIVKHNPDATMRLLTEELYLAKSTVTGLVDELVADRLLDRRRDDEDRRIVRLSLTEDGRSLLERVLDLRRQLVEEATRSLDPNALGALVIQAEHFEDRLCHLINSRDQQEEHR